MRIETHSAADGEIRHATDSLRAPIAKALAEEEERKRQLEEEMRKRLQKELEEMRRREREEERRRSEAGSSGSKDDGVRFSISGINPYESLSRDRQAAQPQKKGTRQGAGAGSRDASLPKSAFDGDEGMAKTIAAQQAAQQEREPAKSVSSALLHLVATKCAGIAPIAYKRAGFPRQVLHSALLDLELVPVRYDQGDAVGFADLGAAGRLLDEFPEEQRRYISALRHDGRRF